MRCGALRSESAIILVEDAHPIDVKRGGTKLNRSARDATEDSVVKHNVEMG